jgi:RNA polymerase sigma factor (sigma-70 family)
VLVDLLDGKRTTPRAMRPVRSRGLGHTVRRALDQLSETARRSLELKYLQGLTNRQVAEALGVSVGCLKRHLAQSRDLLQNLLESDLEA